MFSFLNIEQKWVWEYFLQSNEIDRSTYLIEESDNLNIISEKNLSLELFEIFLFGSK